MDKYINDLNPEVTIKVKDYGVMKLQLFYNVAPNTVLNFIDLVENKFFDGLVFHRVIKDFMIQGGGGKVAAAITGEFESNGFNNELKHQRGVISMARTSYPNSASSQFFIMHSTAKHLDGEYAAFGALIDGFDCLDRIANGETDRYDKPVVDAIILSATIDLKGIEYNKPVRLSE